VHAHGMRAWLLNKRRKGVFVRRSAGRGSDFEKGIVIGKGHNLKGDSK
jgi:hypothetical protein